MREDIPPLFGSVFNPGNWNDGNVRVDRDLILLTTLQKGNLNVGGHYEDAFISPTRMQWQSQTQTARDSLVGRIMSGTKPSCRVHLFARNGKLRNGEAAPYIYCGNPRFDGWEGERPITVTRELAEAVPEHLRRSLGIPP